MIRPTEPSRKPTRFSINYDKVEGLSRRQRCLSKIQMFSDQTKSVDIPLVWTLSSAPCPGPQHRWQNPPFHSYVPHVTSPRSKRRPTLTARSCMERYPLPLKSGPSAPQEIVELCPSIDRHYRVHAMTFSANEKCR